MFRKNQSNKSNTVLIADDTMTRHIRFSKLFTEYCENLYLKTQHVFTASAAIEALAHNRFHMVCLDHDFGTVDDGRTICNWLADNKMCCPDKVLIHSQNPVAANTMKEILSCIHEVNILLLPYKA